MLIIYYSIILLIVVEVFFRLPFNNHIKKINRYSRRSYRVIFSADISDTWKEKAIRIYSGRIMLSTIYLTVYFLLLVCIFLVISGLGSVLSGIPSREELLDFAVSAKVMLVSTIVVIFYFLARKRYGSA